jgi:hypothetical protein
MPTTTSSVVAGFNGPMSVAFVKFCTGYALVAVDVQPCPLAFGQIEITSNVNTKSAPRHRTMVLILILLSKISLLTVQYYRFGK